jgi:hypothetical protein
MSEKRATVALLKSRSLHNGSFGASRAIQQTYKNLSTTNKIALHSIMFIS